MFDRMKEKREQRIREEKERLERQIQAERERLASLSEKELLIEMIFELKRINQNCSIVSSKCDDIARKIVVFSN